MKLLPTLLASAAATALLAGGNALAAPPTCSTCLDPSAFASLGGGNISSDMTIDSGALTFGSYTGVMQGGIAVFDFSNFNLASGVTITVTGPNPVAILSQGNFTIAGTINANGQSPAGTFSRQVGSGGPGGGAGGLGNGYGSGTGGGVFGGGGGNGNGGAGGGGFGGSGAAGTTFNSDTPGAGGGYTHGYSAALGFDPTLLSNLYGGSGGGGGGGGYNYVTGGGGGGGALELGGSGTFYLAQGGQILANGGAGLISGNGGSGGGSGGGILGFGSYLNLNGYASAQGGAGGEGGCCGGGGGGGGGLITFGYFGPAGSGFNIGSYLNLRVDGGCSAGHSASYQNASTGYYCSLSSGGGYEGGFAASLPAFSTYAGYGQGGPGNFAIMQVGLSTPAYGAPEPASIALFGTGLVAAAAVRRRRRRR